MQLISCASNPSLHHKPGFRRHVVQPGSPISSLNHGQKLIAKAFFRSEVPVKVSH
jgi:hypothetical protein